MEGYFPLRTQNQSDEHNWLLLIADGYTTKIEEHLSALEWIRLIITHMMLSSPRKKNTDTLCFFFDT